MANERLEAPERLLNIPDRQPSARALREVSSRGWGIVTFVPTAKDLRGEVALEDEPEVLVHIPIAVIESAHHRDSFEMGAKVDISHRRERSGLVALRINQIVKKKKRA